MEETNTKKKKKGNRLNMKGIEIKKGGTRSAKKKYEKIQMSTYQTSELSTTQSFGGAHG